MILEMRSPNEALRPFIAQYVYHAGYLPSHSKELLLPNGSIDLIIDLSERPKRLYNNENHADFVAFKHGWISGMRSERITIEVSHGLPMLVVSFKPGGAWAFFGFPMSELSDHVEELNSVWGRFFSDLREQLLNSGGPRFYFQILDRFFWEAGHPRLEEQPAITYAVDWLNDRTSPPTVKALAAKLGYSHKHVISLFDKLVGMPPKRYARVLRFQKMVHALSAGQAPESWSRFAQQFGFYDQAHFINEFKAFAGVSPKRYLTLEWEHVNYIAVD